MGCRVNEHVLSIQGLRVRGLGFEQFLRFDSMSMLGKRNHFRFTDEYFGMLLFGV